MASAADNPKLRLEFSGDAFVGNRVPLTVVAAKLQALQMLLFHAAAAVSNDRTSRRGQWYNKYRDVAELSFAASHHSDLAIEAELVPNPVLADAFDTGKQAVNLLFAAGARIAKGLLPDSNLSRDDQRYLLRAFEGLMPNTTDQYQVVLTNCNADGHPKLTLTPESRKTVRRLAGAQPPGFLDEATLVGELIKIHLDSGEDRITIRSGSREVDCFYADSFRDQVANLLAGSIVEVTGRATLDELGQVRKLSEITDVDTVSMEPLRITRFDHAARRYNLTTPVKVNVDYKDGVWVYSNEALNLWGYAERREDALRDLHQSFDYLYREVAEADDHDLDAVARKLKMSLVTLVAKPVSGAA